MDELIRELEIRVVAAEGRKVLADEGSTDWWYHDGVASTYRRAADLAREAKRRMDEQAPAWDLQP